MCNVKWKLVTMLHVQNLWLKMLKVSWGQSVGGGETTYRRVAFFALCLCKGVCWTVTCVPVNANKSYTEGGWLTRCTNFRKVSIFSDVTSSSNAIFVNWRVFDRSCRPSGNHWSRWAGYWTFTFFSFVNEAIGKDRITTFSHTEAEIADDKNIHVLSIDVFRNTHRRNRKGFLWRWCGNWSRRWLPRREGK